MKLLLMGGAALAFILLAVGLYFSFKRIATQQVALQTQKLTLIAQQESAAILIAENKVFEATLRDAAKQKNALERKLAVHDLETLARKKPGLITTRVNNASAVLNRNFEAATIRPHLIKTDE